MDFSIFFMLTCIKAFDSLINASLAQMENFLSAKRKLFKSETFK